MRVYISLSLLIAILLFSCEDTVTVDSGFTKEEVVVDAWLVNEAAPQTIRLTFSQDYFDNSLPKGITDAQVALLNGSRVMPLAHSGDGVYTYDGNQAIGMTGDTVYLGISLDGEEFVAGSIINRVPEADSLVFTKENVPGKTEPEIFGEFYATDFEGEGDTYWLRSTLNDTLLMRPQEISVVYDCTFNPGSGLDGVQFIKPIRNSINPREASGRPRSLKKGDRMAVELHSISIEAFLYLQTVFEQTTNGNNTIFALPIANAKGNVRNRATGERVLGFFNVSNVSKIDGMVE